MLKIFQALGLSLIITILFTACERNKPDVTMDDLLESTSEPSSPAPAPQSQVDPKVEAYLREQASLQSTALDRATVKINDAWNYTGFSFLEPNPKAKIQVRLVAVDVTISGHSKHFDVDDMEVVNGATNFSYGSRPHFAYLDIKTGELAPGNIPSNQPPGPQRILLIYGYPLDSKFLKLAYWSQILNKEAVQIAQQGWGIPFPPNYNR